MRLIEINLKRTKKALQLPSFLGVELSIINFKALFIALLIHFFLPPFFIDYIKQSVSKASENLQTLTNEQSKLSSESKNVLAIKAEVDSYKEKEKLLEKKLQYVKEIIKLRKNPYPIMLYISKNIPEDMWITLISIENDELEIEGFSKSFSSIGVFLDKLNDSVYFKTRPILEQNQTKIEANNEKRMEYFKIKASIRVYQI